MTAKIMDGGDNGKNDGENDRQRMAKTVS